MWEWRSGPPVLVACSGRVRQGRPAVAQEFCLYLCSVWGKEEGGEGDASQKTCTGLSWSDDIQTGLSSLQSPILDMLPSGLKMTQLKLIKNHSLIPGIQRQSSSRIFLKGIFDLFVHPGLSNAPGLVWPNSAPWVRQLMSELFGDRALFWSTPSSKDSLKVAHQSQQLNVTAIPRTRI